MTFLRRSLRRWLRRAAALEPLQPLAWRLRAYRRERARAADTRVRPQLYDRLARIATPPEIDQLEAELRELAASGEPMLFAEWTGSIDMEILYWIPFLTWLVHDVGISRDRCTAVTRPGHTSWYANVAAECTTAASTTPTVTAASLTKLCSAYWNDAGPIVTVLNRLHFRRLPASGERAGVALMSVPELDRFSDLRGVTVVHEGDLDTFTREVSRSTLLVGPASGAVHLGPFLGTPTFAVGGMAPSPHVDIAQRAAHAYRTPLALVAPSSLDLTIDLLSDRS